VQTPLGKGVVRAVRNGGRVLVDVRGRATEFREPEVQPLAGSGADAVKVGGPGRGNGTVDAAPWHRPDEGPAEIDLHGLTTDAALARVDEALNEALLAGRSSLRVIHGRGGGRLKAAVHRRLREIPSVRGFHVDPRNEGVTEVAL
jgi:hypothetical protein